ncbi:hypothetical protein [Thalassoroseus pseudoceratinae]|uniref:hypothetical protein n=1 Tax=Thalassoroseus pseudoceratinae TaxID=2713176 RepID=UPI0014244830|nr:hypothetical protein [Thalassoroseus pseudoceratinae]
MKKLACLVMLSTLVWSGCSGDPPEPPAPSANPEPTENANGSTPQLAPTSKRTVLATVLEMRQGIRDRQLQVPWYLLPSGFRDDVESLIHEFADRVDEELWRNAFNSWRKVHAVLDQQTDFVLNLPGLEELSSVEQERLRNRLVEVAGMLQTILESDLSSLTKLRRISIGEFLKANGAEWISSIEDVNDSSPSRLGEEWLFPLNAEPRVLTEDATTARIGWVQAGAEEPTRDELWVRHERSWMPADWLAVWEQVRLARRKLQSTTEPLGAVENRLQSLRQADRVLTELTAATTAKKFTEIWERDVNAVVRDQIIGQLRTWAGVETSITTTGPATDESTTLTENAGPVPITNATQEDYVTVEVRGKLDESAEDVLFLALEAAIAGDADVLELPGQKHWTSQVGPVRDVSAFAKRLRVGRLVEVDPDNRRIVLEWTEVPGFRSLD